MAALGLGMHPQAMEEYRDRVEFTAAAGAERPRITLYQLLSAHVRYSA